MGMSTHVIGFKPADDQWEKMRDIWDSCKAADIEPPKEVGDFFDWDEPDDRGVEVDITVHEWSDEYCRSGYELCMDEIPKDVKYIRFYNSW